jgi:phage portal protein BeeE
VGLLARIGNVFTKDTTTSDAPAQWFVDWTRGGDKSVAGETVSPDSAMRVSAVWACVNVRSEDVGKLPCILYRV